MLCGGLEGVGRLIMAGPTCQTERSKVPVHAEAGRNRNDFAASFTGTVRTLGFSRARTDDLRCVLSTGAVQALLLGLCWYGSCGRSGDGNSGDPLLLRAL